MAPEQRKQVLLAILAILMAVAAYRLWPASTTGDAPVASNVRGAAKTQGAQSGITAPDVHIESLNEERPKPQELERNVFRFRAKAAPPPPADGGKPAPPPPPVPTGPPPTPGLPPIALKLINIWEYTEQKKKVAVLTDGKGGVPIFGSEGDTVEGRYKILKIGTESVEMAYLDGRGRMTIRLAGQ